MKNEFDPDRCDDTEEMEQFSKLIEEAAQEDKAGSHEAAMLALMRAMEVAAENIDQSDSEGDRLTKRRLALEEKCDWPAIIEVQKEFIRYSENEKLQEQPDAPPHYAPCVACEPWRQLAVMYNIVGEHALALDAADRAVAYALKSDMSPLVTMTYGERAHTLSLLGRFQDALVAAEEALNAIDRELPFTDTLVARYQLQVGRYQARENDSSSAREKLVIVEPTLEQPQCQPDANKAAWLEVRAEVHLAEENWMDAINDLEDAVALRKEAAKTFMGGEEYASARTALTLKRLMEIQLEVGHRSAATITQLDLETLCERFRFPLKAYLPSGC